MDSIVAFFVSIIFFIIWFFVARWVFRVNRMVELQERQIYILTMLARQQGVPGEALEQAMGSAIDPLWKKWLTGYEKPKK